ncbi:MAG: glycosyltransferase [Phycisphaerae bacterium]
MKIAMFTNTYLPHVGGVARSVKQFTDACRRRGHRVLVIAPTYPNEPAHEEDVFRVPAVPHLAGGNFAVALPVNFDLAEDVERFDPDVIHAHHPFLLGCTALRISASRNIPMAFTHHTMYEHYTHYVPVELPVMKRYVVNLATGFANLCRGVIAPSESIAEILRSRGVTTPIDVVPTGVEVDRFSTGDGAAVRKELGIPADAPVIGHVGRLAPEKNLQFLTHAAIEVLGRVPEAHWVVVGDGESLPQIRQASKEADLSAHCHLAGVRKGEDLVNAYHAMDAFLFASHTETQGMVLTEAMAAGCPVVALDAPGSREVTRDGENGRLVLHERVDEFASAAVSLLEMDDRSRKEMAAAARETAERYGIEPTTDRLEEVYDRLARTQAPQEMTLAEDWSSLLRSARREWEIWSNRFSSLTDAARTEHPSSPNPPGFS